MDFGGGDEIRFERRGHAGCVTLTRPGALNALTHNMALALERALKAWETDDAVRLVTIAGEGRAFCAGGDIMDIYKAGKAGNPLTQFFADEYRLNAYIKRYPKPYVALIDGIVMGGGVGVSVHGSHRVFGESATFAMPEVGIGFFPDVGGAYFLPRLKGRSGMWLGLTGSRVKQGDALALGVATHSVASAAMPAILDRLCETGDPEQALAGTGNNPMPALSPDDLALIERIFGADSLPAIVGAARREAEAGHQFAVKALSALEAKSPMSLNVAFGQITRGAALSMDDCMRMEYRILNRMLLGRDFYEGIRAAIIDKGDTPVWTPAKLDLVRQSDVDAYFAPLAEELELS